MYLYQPCLLTVALHAWAFTKRAGRARWLSILFPLGILGISEWELTFTGMFLYPSALLLPALFLLDRRSSVVWLETLTAALLGGFLCWRAADAWPLLPGLSILCGALLLTPIMLICHNRDDRRLASALGGLAFELFFCLKEYMLFSFCVVRLGSRQSLDVCTAALCMCAAFEAVHLAVSSGRKRAETAGN